MGRYYFRLALRSLSRRRGFTVLNVLGLTLGVSVTLLLFWIIRFEKSFDRFQPQADQTFEVRSANKFGLISEYVPPGAMYALRTSIPSVQATAIVMRYPSEDVRIGTDVFKVDNAFFAQPEFPGMVHLDWVTGSPAHALEEPGGVVLDEPTARRLFGKDAMGKTIRFEEDLLLKVVGIIKQVPANSEFQVQMLIPYADLKTLQSWYADDYWKGGESFFHGFVRLKPGADAAAVSRQLDAINLAHRDRSDFAGFSLEPLSQVHFDGEPYAYYYKTPGWLLWALGTIGGFLILLASVNFVNLATVEAIQRSKEVGMRKILGSAKGQVLLQFFMETGLIVFGSIVLGAALGTIALPYVGTFIHTKAAQARTWDAGTLVFLVGLGLTLVALAGTYPAMLSSGVEPVRLLRNRLKGPTGARLRTVLVVGQFAVAQVLVVCMLIGSRQIEYFYHTDMGFRQANVLTVEMPDSGDSLQRERFRAALLAYPDLQAVAFGLNAPSSRAGQWFGTAHGGGLPLNGETFKLQWVDTGYFSFFSIPILAGRDFSTQDAGKVVINEQAARDMGFLRPEDALGRMVGVEGRDTGLIIGVVKDFHSQSLKQGLLPHLFYHAGWNYQNACIRVTPGRDKQAMADLRDVWKQLFPGAYMEYQFVSDDIRNYYGDEARLSHLLTLFCAVGLCIGCLGLYGLVAFVCLRRTKEIGIRKTLGAGVSRILALLAGNFVRLVLVAFLIAAPVGWMTMDRLMRGYAYHPTIPWWIFAAAGAGTLLVTVATLSFQTVRAALANPVDSLRME